LNKKIITLAYLVLFYSFLFVSQVFGLTMELQLSSMDITVGDSFSIDVFAKDVRDGLFDSTDEVIAFGFDLENSDSSIVKFDSWLIGPLFDDDSLFFPNTDIAGSANADGFGGGIIDNAILLATLNYEAISTGNVELGIFSDISDLNEGLIYFMLENKDITGSINLNVNPVPEPATILLLAGGMAGLGAFGRKKFKK